METFVVDHRQVLLAIAGVVVGLVVLWRSNMLRYIPNNRLGIVERLWSARGSVTSGFIALSGEAGFQSDVLRGGWHLMFPFQYRVHVMPLVTIPQGKIGYVFARDGRVLSPTQALASNAEARDLTDVAGFLRDGGQRGPQRQILREGTYAINLVQFVVLAEDGIHYLPLDKDEEAKFTNMAALLVQRMGFAPVVITSDLVGIVTVHDGPSLPQGEIIAPTVGEGSNATHHNSFQDPERFLAAGGWRGRQYQVLVEGTYYINRLFATVECIPKTVVEVGHVGVVISYTGVVGNDLSGEAYRHGELVKPGERGVWSEPLLPGKYAFNTYAGAVLMVPTTNFILKWISSEVGAHRLDENLSEISLIDEQVRAYGGPQLQLTRQVMERFSEAVQAAGIDIVPRVMINGQAGTPGSGGSVFEALLAMMLSDRVGDKVHAMPPRDPRLDQARDAIRDGLVATLRSDGKPPALER